MTLPYVLHPGPGCVVEFLHGNKPQLAIVVSESGGRLRLFTQHKRETNLPAARVLPWSGPQCSATLSRSEQEAMLEERHHIREELEGTIDPMEIWELAQGELDKADLSWFAELLWGKEEARGADRRAALGRVLLQCKTHFRFQPPHFEVHPEAVVEARQIEQAKREAQEAVLKTGERLLPLLWKVHQGRANPPPPPATAEEQDLAAILRKRITCPEDSETGPLWQQLKKGLPPDEPLLPLLLARAWGLVAYHHNTALDQAGYEVGDDWADAFAGDIEAWQAARDTASPMTALLPLASIDGQTTRDIDDAFFIQPRKPDQGDVQGGFICTVALACPALGFPFGSEFDAAVRRRASSLYLPEAVHHMLPEIMGIDQCSLWAGKRRAALLMVMRLDAAGKLEEVTPELGTVVVSHNHSYEAAETILMAEEEDLSGLKTGYALAKLRRARRLERGALQVERSEPEIVLDDGSSCIPESCGQDVQVRFVHKQETPMAQLLVSEIMILVNAAAARWGQEHGVPLLHRTQDVRISAEAQGLWSRPHEIYRAMKGVGATKLELTPRKHATLGEAMYAPVSSPLRRYVDLVNQMQLLHAVQRGTPWLTQEALDGMLASIQAGNEATGRIQRFRTRYWKLEALRQAAAGRAFPAVVVEVNPALVTCAMVEAQLYIRGPRRLFGDDCHLGQHVQLTLDRIDPLHNEMHIAETAVDYEAGESGDQEAFPEESGD